MTVAKAVNPYAVGRKPSSKPPTTTTATAAVSKQESRKAPAIVGRGFEEKKETNAPRNASDGNSSNDSSSNAQSSWHTMFDNTTGGTSNGTTVKAKVPLVQPKAKSVATNTKVNKKVSVAKAKAPPASQPQQSQASLKAKLKKDIENLKRAKLLYKQRLEEEKRKKVLEKQQRKQKAAAELIQKKNKKLKDEEEAAAAAKELLMSASQSTPLPALTAAKENNNVQAPRVPIPVKANLNGPPLSSPQMAFPFQPSHHPTQAQTQGQTSAYNFQHQHQRPSLYPPNAPPPPPLPPPSFASNDMNAARFQQQYPSPQLPPMSFPPGGGGAGSPHLPPMSFPPGGGGRGSWNQNQNPMFPVHMASQQQQQQQPHSNAPPMPVFAGSQHVTPSPAMGSSKQQALDNHTYYATNNSPPASFDRTLNSAAQIHTSMTQQQEEVPSNTGTDGRVRNWTPNHHVWTMNNAAMSEMQMTSTPAAASTFDKTLYSTATQISMPQEEVIPSTKAKTPLSPEQKALVYTNNEHSDVHQHTKNEADQAMNNISSFDSVVRVNRVVAGIQIPNHHPFPPNARTTKMAMANKLSAPNMETDAKVATTKNVDQSLLLHASMDTTTTTQSNYDVPKAPMVVQDSRDTTATGSGMPNSNVSPSSLLVAAQEERANIKHTEVQLSPTPSVNKSAPTPFPTPNFPAPVSDTTTGTRPQDLGLGGHTGFVPQPMQYSLPNSLAGQQQHYPNPMLGHTDMNGQQQQRYPNSMLGHTDMNGQKQHNPNPMLGHTDMNNYGGYQHQPYAGSAYPNHMTSPQLQQQWDMQQIQQQPQPWAMQQQMLQQPQSWTVQQQQQQQQQHFYQQPPIPYRMPSVVPSFRSKPLPPRPVAVVPKPAPKRVGAERLANVLKSPSPFLLTHELLPFTITMVKKPGESFGATLKAEIESALVEPEWSDKMPGGTVGELKPKSLVHEPVKTVEMKVNVPAVEMKVNDPAVEMKVVETKAEAVVSSGKTETSAIAVTDTAVVQTLQSEEKPDVAPSSGGTATAANDAKGADTQKAEVVKSRRARRRRVFFAAMTVINPKIQNQRLASSDPSKRLLMQGDILLVINGNKTAGLTFHDACTLFASCNQVADDGMVHCTVTIARRKPKAKALNVAVPPAPANFPVALPTTGPTVRELDLSTLKPLESSAFANSLLKAICDSKRLLGRPVSDSLLRSVTSLDPALSARGFPTLKDTWSSISQGLERRMAEKALSFWKSQWKNEPSEVKSSGMEYLTDAQRSSMRAAPRPPKGCRCGKIDHDYCHDHRCPLYSDIRAADPVSAESKESGPKRISSKLPRDLNTVETAFKDRFVRLQAEKEAQEAEARFVDRMEDLQLKKHSKAVFAPSLTAMVLSTVHELQGYCKDDVIKPVPDVAAAETSQVVVPVNENDSDDDSDDEDVPLAALGKRTQNDSVGAANKKQKTEMVVRRKFLAKLIQSISKKWGHVYREPSDVEYAWRWEVHHGQISSETSSRWEASFKNPRRTGALTFENTHFVVEDGVVSKVEDPISSQEQVDALQLLLHVLSPTRSGVCDELLALIQMGVLAVDERGLPALCHDWWSNVDVLLLDDMAESWGVAADPSGKYGITDAVRMPLDEQWTKAEDGWALGEEDTVYEDSEFDAWRAAFEDKQQAQSDNIEGVGRFGI